MNQKRRRVSASAKEPPPLSPTLAFMRLLWGVAHGLELTSKSMHARLGITGPQRLVIRLVGYHTSLSAGELARVMHRHPSSLTGMLRRLERAGLLKRTKHPQDARRAVLTLTARGRRLNADKAGTVEALTEHALRTVSKRDRQAAERVLHALANQFEVAE